MLIATVCAGIDSAEAQDWAQHWIYHPCAGKTEQVLFRHDFSIGTRPEYATLTIASAGRYRVFINGYDISTHVLEPCIPALCKANHPAAGNNPLIVPTASHDVARFLINGENTIAVWYSPYPYAACTAAGGSLCHDEQKKQLSAILTIRNGNATCCTDLTDKQWLCRTAGADTTPYGGETISGKDFSHQWNMPGEHSALWVPAEELHGYAPSAITAPAPPQTHMRIERIERHSYSDNYGSEVVYRFTNTYSGWARVTLRGMNTGDTIRVNKLTYICSGHDDEQACRRFTSETNRTVTVSGPPAFSVANVMDVEAITIEPHTEYVFR